MRRPLAKQVGSLIGIGGVAFSITLLSQSMRAVEAVGGTCASGGPYAISRPCPNGVAGALPLAIVGGLIFLGLFVVCASDRGRSVAMLAWSALFLTLAWNFIDYGLKGGSGGGAGFLIPGVLFVIMGAAPLFYVVPSMWKAFLGQDPDQSAAPSPFLKYAPLPSTGAGAPAASSSWPSTSAWGTSSPAVSTATPTITSTPAASTATVAGSSSSGSSDLASELERLASLHRRGELSDTEYEAAKQKALSHGGTT
ncbi:MAG TPA: SHOCT domain-containing protein [Acidimicrobiia bacterium]